MVVGIDEVGRGPLAGPVTVGAFIAPYSMRGKLIKLLGGKIKDSKKLTHEQRSSINRSICDLKQQGKVDFRITHISNSAIDKKGISKAITQAITLSLKKLHHKFSNTKGDPLSVRLDGLLKAPEEYRSQKTIIKGDEKDVFIACASIVAKVKRDRLMSRLAKKYPLYAFNIHKGYGTTKHRQLIKKYGLSSIHRLTFCKNI